MTLGLGNIRALMGALDNPEQYFRSVVVAGTNGKGSVTAFLAGLLQAAGLKVGWFSSPHVYSVRERIRINGVPVPLEDMERAAERIRGLHQDIGYSYFEALTAIAYLLFAESRVDVAVLETGLGGRFDATNVVEPAVSVLTSIGLDHRRILGDTEEEILREKLGISRPGVPLLTGPLSQQLMEIIGDKAEREGIALQAFDTLGSVEVTSTGFEGMSARVETPVRDYGEVSLPFQGAHQANNALLAIAAAETILDGPAPVADGAALTDMPGRFEVVRSDDKTLVLDVGHNDDALLANLETLASFSPRENNALVLGILRRKEFDRFPAEFAKWVSRVYLVEPYIEPPRGDKPPTVPTGTGACPAWVALDRIGFENIYDSAVDFVLVPPFKNEAAWEDFMPRLLSPANKCGVALVTGSHHTVEQAGRALHAMGVM